MKVHLFIVLAITAVACVNKQPPPATVNQTPTSPDFKRGEYFNDSTEHSDSAFFYFNNVTENSTDSLLTGMAYAYMAMIQNNAGDYYGVQESALAGIKILDEKNPNHAYCLSSLYNVLGRSEVGLKDYDAAITHYKLAEKYQPYEGYKNTYRNNIAVAFREKKDYGQALEMFMSIEPQPDESRAQQARRITNIASLKWQANKIDPVADLHHALLLRIRGQDQLGITASYNHLAEYYMTQNRDSALYYAGRMYRHSQLTANTEDQLDALRKLTSLASDRESRAYFERYELLSDSLQTTRAAAKNQFAVIRYESEKSKNENLALQEDNASKKLQILKQNILLVAIVFASAIAIAAALWYYRRKRKEAEQRSQALIRENQLKLSQKIHDTVANGLYRIMGEIEHQPNLDKEQLLDRVEELYERSRDISYEPPSLATNPGDRINETLASFATPEIKVSVVGNQADMWHDVDLAIVNELEHVLQELAVNMKKHSGARHVVFHFAKTNNLLHILYKDDGTGFRSGFRKGNGLRSTENRISKIGGEATFTNGTANGAEIKIIVPTDSK